MSAAAAGTGRILIAVHCRSRVTIDLRINTCRDKARRVFTDRADIARPSLEELYTSQKLILEANKIDTG